MEKTVCRSEDLVAGQMLGTTLGPVPLCVGRTGKGELFAVVDKCLHQGGPLSRGRCQGTTEGDKVGDYRYVREGEVIKCPWHGYEYEAMTGRALAEPERQLRTFRVWERDQQVWVEL